ncbi:MAG: NAD-dependent epimerase/dehydratase family protein [Nanoarchaeota archaeon]
MKIFITGGAGFIGSNMTDRLIKEGHSVTVYDNLISGREDFIKHHYDNPNFKIINADLLDKEKVIESMKGHDMVFHFAANPDIAKSMIETDIDLRLGIVATYNVVEAMRLNGVKKLGYPSGSGVYGDVGLTPTPENFGPLLPISMYGASKLGAEGVISAFCHMFDMQAWIFRFANVVGRKQTHGVGYDFIRKLKKDSKRLEILGDGSQSKSYIHVDDVIDAMLFAIEKSNDKVNLFNVATDEYITVNDIASIVIEEMGLSSVELQHTGGDRGWKGDVPVVRFDITKIHNLGWKSKHNSSEAIRLSIKELLEL